MRPTRGGSFPVRAPLMSPRARGVGLLPLLALLLAACGTASTPSPTPGGNGVALVTGASVSATMGPEGGELTASDAEQGRSYRLTVPAGALAETTTLTVSPIAAIDGFPLDGGLLGGVELQPAGAVSLAPLALEITLDSDRQTALRAAVDGGGAIVGFRYPGGAAAATDELTVTLAEVADDGSSVTLTLFGFSGHGAGVGSPQNLANLPTPSDPVKAAELFINRILHPPGGPHDASDPAAVAQVRAQIAQVFRDWLAVLEVVIDSSTDDPVRFGLAVKEAEDWWKLALISFDGLVTDFWSAPGDELYTEGQRLDAAIYAGWQKAFTRANSHCQATIRSGPQGGQDLGPLLDLLKLHADSTRRGLEPPALKGIAALVLPLFCAKLTLTTDGGNPTQLAEGGATQFGFRLKDTTGAVWLDTQLETLGAELTATVMDPSVLTASPRWSGFYPQVDVTALRAVAGSTSEGRFEIRLSLFGTGLDYASASATFDITSAGPTPPPPIVCTGSPVTVTSTTQEAFIGIRYDGGSGCAIIPNLSDDDDPNVILALDLDPGETGWDAHDGANWTRESYGSNNAAGTFTVRVRHDPSGRTYTLKFTVELTPVNGGASTKMTVRDATISS